ncbi:MULTISPECIES: MarR family winged helix-turn-helix transcriptional regulator [Streptomyces]|jgi:DNA-binding MarR family transcriptional regulator|uniref:MarR family transcriptional regulator n=1 Tax=Streptomyces prunicolor TaxID=67348 RepID=A0ABU4FEL1_9ACTN|nr:MarR family transcriptional regulator [Streptomyces prunicolor]MDV7219040.1 MarR family transcriptional regulator [Streptomyces prunicolor]WTE48512.1 MarR family transcriptional regulator [Streptomyces sp. NBC_01622]
MHDRAQKTDPAAGPDGDQRWADLADLVLIISREIQFRRYTDERAVHLSQSEGMVMRYLKRDPAAPPSRIAAATGLQRTNLSTVLRGLEDKGFIERHAHSGDGRGVTVHSTERGRSNTILVRQEWAATVSAAADHDTRDLDATLSLLTAVEAGLTRGRP